MRLWPDLTSASFEELAKRRDLPSKCNGSQAKAVTNCLCPARVRPICFPVWGSQRATVPALSPEATLVPFGAQLTARTHCEWALHSKCGVSVVRSQNRTVLSPDPETRCWPSGENCAAMTVSPWPGIELVQRDTGRTLKWQEFERTVQILIILFSFCKHYWFLLSLGKKCLW